MDRGFDGVHGRLDVLNGKTATNSSAIAVHEDRWRRLDQATSVRTESAPRAAEPDGKVDWKTTSTILALAVGAISGLITGVVQGLKMLGLLTP